MDRINNRTELPTDRKDVTTIPSSRHPVRHCAVRRTSAMQALVHASQASAQVPTRCKILGKSLHLYIDGRWLGTKQYAQTWRCQSSSHDDFLYLGIYLLAKYKYSS